MTENLRTKIDSEFEAFIRKKFTYLPENENQEMINNIQSWILNSNRYRKSLKDLLDYCARTIYRLFGFKEISIGVKDLNDGLYKYITILGFKRETEKAQRKITYTLDEILDYEKYPGIKLSTMSDYCIAAGMEEFYNRPLELDKKRVSMEDFMEGDYIDTSIYDSKVQLIGWIELANPKNGKIPNKETLFWIELIASILGLMIEREISLKPILK